MSQQKRLELFINENVEPSYKKFQEKLLPGVDNIIGVRIPAMHKYTNQLIKEGITVEELKEFGSSSFEEIMIEGMLISKGNWEQAQRIDLIESFVPKIQNWSHCDTFCKFVKDVNSDYLPMIKKHANMNDEYSQRFALVMLLEHFIQDEYVEIIFKIIEQMNITEYYAQMATAWLLTTMQSKYPDEVYEYLKRSTLDDWTKKKTVQKLSESFKTSEEELDKIKNLKKGKLYKSIRRC